MESDGWLGLKRWVVWMREMGGLDEMDSLKERDVWLSERDGWLAKKGKWLGQGCGKVRGVG